MSKPLLPLEMRICMDEQVRLAQENTTREEHASTDGFISADGDGETEKIEW